MDAGGFCRFNMACYHPVEAWRMRGGDITFKAGQGVGSALHLPCGRCIGCRLERSRQWAMRCIYEASLYQSNCFVTLTYDDEHLPSDGGLRKRHLQLFIKRLRKEVNNQLSKALGRKLTLQEYLANNVRYFACAEYGDEGGRPHYHAILFNWNFSDKEKIHGRSVYYSSATLDRLWGHGMCIIGEVSFESAAYVARYCTKKLDGQKSAPEDGAPGYYSRVDVSTGEIVVVEKERSFMSLKPGIGARWFEKYKGDVFPSDFVIVNGKKMAPPKYFDKLLERSDGSDVLDQFIIKRIRKASKSRMERVPERLEVREKVQHARAGLSKRTL